MPEPVAADVPFRHLPVSFDFDADGDLDLVGSHKTEQSLFVLPNLGSDGFGRPRLAPLSLGPGRIPGAMGVSDFDGTGTLSLFIHVTTGSFGGRLHRYTVEPDGTLVRRNNWLLPSDHRAARTMEFRDIDGDGALDVVFERPRSFPKRRDAWVGFRRGTGYDFVDLETQSSIFARPGLVDVDQDGRLDLVGKTSNSEMAWVPQVAPGVFGSAIVFDTTAPTRELYGVSAADLDADGELDLIYQYDETMDGADAIVLQRGLGGGAFGPEVSLNPAGSSLGRCLDLGIEDVDRDGDLDIVALPGEPLADTLSWTENEGGFQFALPAPITEALNIGFDDLRLLDLGGAGTRSVLFNDLYREELYLLQPGPGGLIDGLQAQIIDQSRSHALVEAGDFRDAGVVDLVTGNDLAIAYQDGAGHFQIPFGGLFGPAGFMPDAIATGDLNGDGRADLLTLEAGTIRSWDLSSSPPLQTTVGSASFTRWLEPIVIDLEGDGDLDVLGAAPTNRDVRIFEQQSDGTFVSRDVLASHSGIIQDIEAADLDADGGVDLLVATSDGSGVPGPAFRVKQAPDGTFYSPRQINLDGLTSPSQLLAADLDASGTMDLVWVTAGQSRIMVAEGIGGGFLGLPREFDLAGGSPVSLAARRRLNGGGFDLVVGLEDVPLGAPNAIRVLRRTSGLNFAPPLTVAEPAGSPTGLVAADLDGDGDVDLAYGRPLAWVPSLERSTVSEPFCANDAQPNSTGLPGSLEAVGSLTASDNDLTLVATELPPGTLTLFIASMNSQVLPGAGGGSGTLCLDGAVGRFLQPGQAGSVSAGGVRRLEVDLTAVAQPGGSVAIVAGERWFFQAWHRDVDGSGGSDSNFSFAVSVSFD